MICLEHEQGTDEWLKARIGIPTSSNFDKLITSKGEPSKQAQKYCYQLAVERVTGVREEVYKNGAMARGTELEAEARNLYEMLNGVTVQKVGLCLSDNSRFGASPDGLVGKNGMLEIKCPLAATHVAYLLDGVIPSDYVPQVQGQLLVTGLRWVDFMSYYPGVKPLIVRVKRNEEFIAKLEKILESFCDELDQIAVKIS